MFASALCFIILVALLCFETCPGATSPGPSDDPAGSTGLPGDLRFRSKGRLTIQQRLDAAADGDTIPVEPGTYFEHINFKGKAVCLKSTDGPKVTVIDGEGYGSVVMFPDGGDTTSILDGFTLRNGGGTKEGDRFVGGGIRALDSGATIKYCIIIDNIIGDPLGRKSRGGGGYFTESTVIIDNCTITGNKAGTVGGLDIRGGLCRITDCTFLCNETFGTDNQWGGSGGAVILMDVINSACSSNYFGFNQATRHDEFITEGRGGAIYISGCSPEINKNLFYRNKASYGGAIAVISDATLTIPVIHHNIFLENSAGDEWGKGVGGAIYDWGTYGNAQALIYNNVFDGNGAHDFGEENGCGGAVAHAGRGGDIANNIVMNTFSGRGLNVPESCDHHHNCFWNNADGDVLYPGEGSIFIDPDVSRASYYRLPPGSPCIDAGWDADLGELKCGAEFDIGAFEHCGDRPVLPWYNMVSPRIAVSDSAFRETGLAGGESPVDSLFAWNYGVRDLEYSFEASAGEWLLLEGPLEGVLEPGDTVMLLLHYETSGLEDGSYADTLNLVSSDPWRPLLEIPVALNVYSHGIIRVPDIMPTIQSAIDVTIDGDTVLVAPGTFTGEGNRDIDFLGRAITVMSEYPHTETIIDCENLGRGFLFESDETADSRLQGFIIRNGYHKLRGGGIYCFESSPLILECNIENCDAGTGGGLYCKNGSPIVGNCLISGCSAGNGGGVRIYSTTLSAMNCTIVDNSAEYKGGGFYSYISNLNISNSIVRGNTTTSIDYYGDMPLVTFTNIEGGWAGQSNIDLPAMFAGGGDYSLLEGSPCIDTGNPETPNIPWGGSRRDMGAFEFDQGWYLDDSGNIVRKPLLLNGNPYWANRSLVIPNQVPVKSVYPTR